MLYVSRYMYVFCLVYVGVIGISAYIYMSYIYTIIGTDTF